MTHHQESVALAAIIAAALILVTVACVVGAYSHHHTRSQPKREVVRNFRRWRRDRLEKLRTRIQDDPRSYGYENEEEAKLRLITLDDKIACLDALLKDRKTLFCEKLRAQAR